MKETLLTGNRERGTGNREQGLGERQSKIVAKAKLLILDRCE
ncbi:hypothetical protein [Brasilonema bromeliae]